MATSSPCRIKDKRTTFPRLPASKAARTNRSLRLPLQTRLGDVSKGPSRQTHPLINNTTFHFQAPSRHSQIYSNRTPYGTLSPINQITPSVVVVRDTTSMFQADFRVLRHYNNAAESMAEVRGRNEAVKAIPQRKHIAEKCHLNFRSIVWGHFLQQFHILKENANERAVKPRHNRQDPLSFWAQATSMAALPTITLDRWELNRHLLRRALQK